MCAEVNEIIFFILKDDLFSLIYQICLGIGDSSRCVKLLRYTENTQTRDDITIYGHRKLEQEEMRFVFFNRRMLEKQTCLFPVYVNHSYGM